MNHFLSVTIPEQPISMQRPRLSKSHVYNPQAAQKIAHGWLFKAAMMKAHKNCTSSPLHIDFIFAFKRSKSNRRKYPITGIDIDNAIKYYLDSMQGMQGCGGIVYFNDSQCVELTAKKIYSVEPCVNIDIFEL